MATKTRKTRIAALKKRFPSTNPKKKEREKTVVSRALAEHIVANVLERKPLSAARWIRSAILPALPIDSAWYAELKRLAANLTFANSGKWDCVSIELFSLSGNVKLPFATWSTIPGATCPGAGACLQFCYSFKSWRYPAALTRQLFATMAIRNWREELLRQWLDLPRDIIVRLYVDGDIASAEELEFWFDLCSARPDLTVYGYSKSWRLLVDVCEARAYSGRSIPANYVLNLSSGSIHENDTELLRRLMRVHKDNGVKLVRGRFVAVGIDNTDGAIERGHARYANPEYHKRVRESAELLHGQKAFSCPGDCGACGAKMHICGNENANVLVAIGIH